MPELPEVERARRLADRVGVGRRIVSVWCADDPIVISAGSPRRIRRALGGRTIVGTGRRGKYFWLELDRRPWPLFHLGMTGDLRCRGETPIQMESSPGVPETDWPPRFSKLRIGLDDGAELAFINKRRLGRLRLIDDPLAAPPVSRLGFDPLTDLPSPVEFANRLSGRGGVVKAVLLDQGFAAGVGNWIADEVLYQARLDPRRRADTLSRNEMDRLRRALKRVVARAVAVDADKTRFPRTWLFHRRWGKPSDARIGGHPVEFLTVGGRTTAWVPARQR